MHFSIKFYVISGLVASFLIGAGLFHFKGGEINFNTLLNLHSSDIRQEKTSINNTTIKEMRNLLLKSSEKMGRLVTEVICEQTKEGKDSTDCHQRMMNEYLNIQNEQKKLYDTLYDEHVINFEDIGYQKNTSDGYISSVPMGKMYNQDFLYNEENKDFINLIGSDGANGTVFLLENKTIGGSQPTIYVFDEYNPTKRPSHIFTLNYSWKPNDIDKKETKNLFLRAYYTDETYTETMMPVNFINKNKHTLNIPKGSTHFIDGDFEFKFTKPLLRDSTITITEIRKDDGQLKHWDMKTDGISEGGNSIVVIKAPKTHW